MPETTQIPYFQKRPSEVRKPGLDFGPVLGTATVSSITVTGKNKDTGQSADIFQAVTHDGRIVHWLAKGGVQGTRYVFEVEATLSDGQKIFEEVYMDVI